MTKRFQITLFFASVACAGLCRADIAGLPPTSVGVYAGLEDGSTLALSGFGALTYNGAGCSAAAAASGGFSTSVSSSSSATAVSCVTGDFAGSQSDSSITYSVELVGPNNGPPFTFSVPVDLTAFLQASSSLVPPAASNNLFAVADAYLAIDIPAIEVNAQWAVSVGDQDSCYTQALDVVTQASCASAAISLSNIDIGFFPNTEYDITILTDASTTFCTFAFCDAATETFAGTTISASAEVDPTFAIDPSFQDAAAYSLVYGPGGVGGPSAVTPEPSYLIFIAVGLGSLLLARWQRQQGEAKRAQNVSIPNGSQGSR